MKFKVTLQDKKRKKMILFQTETKFTLKDKLAHKRWIKRTVENEGKKCGDINYVFYNDEDLLAINVKYLSHDFYTDIITFDYTENNIISGDIAISIDRVVENAKTYNVDFEAELKRVLIHGILHLCGYKDKNKEEEKVMREKETFYMNLFHKYSKKTK